MDIKQLEAFSATARFKSFSKAADFLYLSQPTVSAHIHNLEKELGGPLINRRSQQFKLTDLGESILQKAIYLLQTRDEIYEISQAQSQSSSLGIIIAASTIPAEYLLPGVISEFMCSDLTVHFKVLEKNSEDAIEMVRHDLCDIGVVGTFINFYDLAYKKLLDDELFFVTSFASDIDPVVSINDLMDIPFVLREERSGTYMALKDALKDAGSNILHLNNIMVMGSNEGIKSIIEKNRYMACLSGFCVKRELKEGSLKKIVVKNVNPHRSFYLTYLKNKIFTPAQSRFIDSITDMGRTR